MDVCASEIALNCLIETLLYLCEELIHKKEFDETDRKKYGE
jgi:hypothetical protein